MKLKFTLLILIFSAKIFSQSLDNKNSLSLIFIGDIMGHSPQISSAYNPQTKTYDYIPVFEKVAPIISNADFAIANLEVTLAGKPYKGYPQFSSPDALAYACKESGIDVLLTSNNHSCDRRKKGILRTIEVLDSAKILHTGTFKNAADRAKNNLLILEKNNIKIGILNYTYGTNGLPTPPPTIVNRIDTSVMLPDIRESKKANLDKLIVCIHWGLEYKSHPSTEQEKTAKLLFDNGVDIIIGSHPHVLQRMEHDSISDQFIVYSLGNYVSNQRARTKDGGAMVKLTLTKADKDVKIANAGYYLTWVNKTKENGKDKYQIIPCYKAEENNFEGLSSSSIEKMNIFTSDSRSLFKSENINVSEITTDIEPVKKEAVVNYNLYPVNNQQNINPDTHLKISFNSQPNIGNKGLIRVYDSSNDSLVDVLDMSIPAGPTESRKNPKADYTKEPYQYISGNFTNKNTKPGTPSGTATANSDTFQLTIIGGFTDAFHFFPIIVHDNTAIINLHHNLLEYGKEYYVTIDSTVVNDSTGSFKGIYEKAAWTFSTKAKAPQLTQKKFVVDDSRNGDFNTVQGALDFIPDNYQDTVEIFIKNGIYEEIVYFRNKSNIIIRGEDREKTIVQYANNEVFNPHPWDVKTNEWPGTFPSRRAAFAIDNCSNIQLLNLTVKTPLPGQAEGLLINGDKIFVKGVNIIGSGDALQTNGTAYFEDVRIDGDKDIILGRGAAFFKSCEFHGPGPFMWIRNTKANHGNVFVDCKFYGTEAGGSSLARAPINNKIYSYPYSESVLINCQLDNIMPEGWGPVGGKTRKMRYWEYNSTNISDGKPVYTSNRAKFTRQLNLRKDKKRIDYYSNPANILKGWKPCGE